MSFLRMLGRTMLAVLLLFFTFLAKTHCATPADVRKLLLEAKEEQPFDLDNLIQHLEPMDPGTIAALRISLRDKDPFIRATSVSILGAVGDRPVKTVARLLKDDAKEVRDAAEKALVVMGEPAGPVLGEMLLAERVTSDCFDRTLRILDVIADESATPFLMEAAVKHRGHGGKAPLIVEAFVRSKKPAAEDVSRLLKYRDLKEPVMEAIREHDREHKTSYQMDMKKAGIEEFQYVGETEQERTLRRAREARVRNEEFRRQQLQNQNDSLRRVVSKQKDEERAKINAQTESAKEEQQKYEECVKEVRQDHAKRTSGLNLPLQAGIQFDSSKQESREAQRRYKREQRDYYSDKERLEMTHQERLKECAELYGGPLLPGQP